jgi:hypothetical protein
MVNTVGMSGKKGMPSSYCCSPCRDCYREIMKCVSVSVREVAKFMKGMKESKEYDAFVTYITLSSMLEKIPMSLFKPDYVP